MAWIVSNIFLNSLADYAVIFAFLIYCAIHQAMIDRVVRRNKIAVGFGDKLFLFRVPKWRANAQLTDAVLGQANHLAWQFVSSIVLVLLYFVMATVAVFVA